MFRGLGAFLGTTGISPFRVTGMNSAVGNFGRARVSIMALFDGYMEKDCTEATILPFDTPLE